jgi:hypothetical protein
VPPADSGRIGADVVVPLVEKPIHGVSLVRANRVGDGALVVVARNVRHIVIVEPCVGDRAIEGVGCEVPIVGNKA